MTSPAHTPHGHRTTAHRWLWSICVLTSCLQSPTRECADGWLCPPGYSCVGTPSRCASDQEIAACGGLDDGDPCQLLGADGVCSDGACAVSSCGDGQLKSSEVCDGALWQDGPEAAPTCYEAGGDYGRVECNSCSIDPTTCQHLFWNKSFVVDDTIQDMHIVSDDVIYLITGEIHGTKLQVLTRGELQTITEVEVPTQLWAASESSVWVTTDQGLHFYNGSTWSVIEGEHTSVWGSGANDVWAAGVLGLGHFDGQGWTHIDAVPTLSYALVWGFAGDDVFYGGRATDEEQIYHFDGDGWTRVDGGSNIRPWAGARNAAGKHCIVGEGPGAWGDLWCRENNVWQYITVEHQLSDIGIDQQGRLVLISKGGHIYTDDGEHFYQIERATANDLNSIAYTSSGTLVAGGGDGVWLEATSSAWASAPFRPLVPDNFPRGGQYFLWASEDQAVAVGQRSTTDPPRTFEQDTLDWLEVPTTAEAYATSLCGSADGTVFMTTTTDPFFTITGSVPSPVHRKAVDDPAWAELPITYPGTIGRFFGCWARSNSDVYFLEQSPSSAAIVRYDGTFSVLHSENQPLRAISGAGSSVFAVGDNGVFLRYRDGAVERFTTPTDRRLRAVWAFSEDFVIAAGSNGTLLLFDGTEVRELSSPISEHLIALSGTGPDDVFALGIDYGVAHYDGFRWSPVRIPPNEHFVAVAATSRAVHFASEDGKLYVITRPGPWIYQPPP